MKKDLLKFSFIWRFAVSLLTCTGLVIFLIWNRILFFGESQATDQYAMQIEPYRPVFYNCMLVLILVTYLAGVVIAYRKTVTGKADTGKNVKMPRSVLVIGAAVFIVFNACVSYGIIELINNPWIKFLKPIHILLGIGITLVLYLILVFLTNSLTVGMIIGNAVFLVWGAANFFVLKFRSTALQFVDFMSIRTAFSVAGGYSLYMFWQFAVGIVVTVCLCLFWLYISNFHMFGKVRGKIAARGGAFALAMLFIWSFSIQICWPAPEYGSGTGIRSTRTSFLVWRRASSHLPKPHFPKSRSSIPMS